MKLNNISTILKYKKSYSNICQKGMQISSSELMFTNLINYVFIENYANKHDLFNIDTKGIYKENIFIDSSEFIDSPELNNLINTFEINNELNKTISNAINFAGNDDLRPVLKGLYFDKSKVVATDAHILFSEAHGLNIEDSFILNLDFCKFLKYAYKLEIYDEYSVCHLTIQGLKCRVVGRLVNGTYPRYSAVLPNINDYISCININKEDFKDIKALCKRNDKLHFDINNNNLISKSPKNNNILLMPYKMDTSQSVSVSLLERVMKGCNNINLYINKSNKNKPYLIEFLETKTKTVKKRTLSELIQELEILKQQNKQLKQLIKIKN